MELSFQNNASISLLTIFDKPEPPEPDDFWAKMYDRPVVKYGLTLFTISTLVLLTPYLYISLMFIHDKHFKTIVTYGEEMICFFGLLIQLCLITPCLLRILLGPLSTTLCWWQVFFSQFLSISYMVVFCTNYMARYFYVVVYKTATICNDDFIGFFTFIEILTMGFGFSLLHNISPGKFAINYYVCQGIDPESDTTEGKKFTVTPLLSLFTLIIFVLVNFKLYRAKKGQTFSTLANLLVVPNQNSFQLPSPKQFFSEKFFPMVTQIAWSSIDLMTIWMLMILLTCDAILWNGYMKKLTVEEIQTTGWGHFCFLYHQHLLCPLGLWSFAISTFVRKPNLRKHVLETIHLDLEEFVVPNL